MTNQDVGNRSFEQESEILELAREVLHARKARWEKMAQGTISSHKNIGGDTWVEDAATGCLLFAKYSAEYQIVLSLLEGL